VPVKPDYFKLKFSNTLAETQFNPRLNNETPIKKRTMDAWHAKVNRMRGKLSIRRDPDNIGTRLDRFGRKFGHRFRKYVEKKDEI